MKNYMMMQFFEWHIANDGNHWNRLNEASEHLAEMGCSRIWIPPAMKASQQDSVGYDVYDLYDLGEFDQKGTTRTRYGDKESLQGAVDRLHALDIQVVADVVLNHKAGADQVERFAVVEVGREDRLNQVSEPFDIEGWTQFNFEGRNNTYSDFKWDFTHFTSTDRDEMNDKNGVYKIIGENKDFSNRVDYENMNYDYLMFSDIDLNHTEVINELHQWSEWFVNEMHLDGFRMDALKHMDAIFVKNFIANIRNKINPDFFIVGEYWDSSLEKLKDYLAFGENNMHLFDVALHYNFVEASQQGKDYDLTKIFHNTLVSTNPVNVVTFVDNHDSQDRAFVDDWFKSIAYALIMLRYDGYPCVFYGDYYGVGGEYPRDGFEKVIDTLAYVRKDLAYGEQHDYFDHRNVIGWTRLGDEEHPHSGVAVVISNSDEGDKEMWFNAGYKGKTFYDILGGRLEHVTIDDEGKGHFTVNPGSVSVWVEKFD